MAELSGIQLGTGFVLQAEKPLDLRQQYDTIELMRSMPDSSLYEGIVAYVLETGKFYRFSITNDRDIIYGRWREYSEDGSALLRSRLSIVESADTGFAKTYEFYQGPVNYNEADDTYDYSEATKIGTVGIPLDLVISAGYLANIYKDDTLGYAYYYEYNNPTNRKVELDWDKYKFEKYLLSLHIANSDGSKIEIPLSTITPDPYKPGDNIVVDDDNTISAVGFLKQTDNFLGLKPGLYQYIGDDELLVYGGVYNVTDTDVELLFPKEINPCPEQYIHETYEIRTVTAESYFFDFTECVNWDDLLNFGCPQKMEITEEEYNLYRTLYDQDANQLNYSVADSDKIHIIDDSQAILLSNIHGDTAFPNDLIVTFKLLNNVDGEYVETSAVISCYVDPKMTSEEISDEVTFEEKFEEMDKKIELAMDDRISDDDIIELFR